MPSSTTTRPTRHVGIVCRDTYAWSECGNYDDGYGSIDCTRCGAVLFHSEDGGDDPAPGEVEALYYLHGLGFCLIAAGVRAVAAHKARREAASYDGSDGEPF